MFKPSRREILRGYAAAVACPTLLPSLLSAADPKSDSPRKFQLGLVTYNTAADWDLPTILSHCKKAGIAAVECRTTHAHKVEPSLNADERKKVQAMFADSGVVFWGCGSICEFHDPDATKVKKQIEDCKAFVKLVSDLGGKGVKVRPNGLPKDVPVEKTLEQIGKALIECGKAAADAGVEIWVEVHGAGTQEPANMAAIMKHCDHKSVGVTWNSNPTDVKNGSVKESFALLKPWIRSCHINNIGAEKGYPYRELFALFREMGYDRYTLIEDGKKIAAAEGEEFLRKYKAKWDELSKA